MPNKQWHRDKIAELEIERKRYYNLQTIIPSLMVSLGAVMVAGIAIYYTIGKKYNYMYALAILLVVLILTLNKIQNSASKKEKAILRRIKHNYDALLDRDTNKPYKQVKPLKRHEKAP